MRNIRISVVCLLWLGVWLPGVQTASGQEDSTRVRRDSLRTVGAGVGMPVEAGVRGVGADEYRLEPSLEAGREVPVFRPVRRDPDLRLPYQENPSLRFKGDFRTEGSLWRWRTGQIYGMGSQTSLPGIGLRNEAAFSFEQELNDRLSLQATVDAVRMNMAYFNRRQSLGLSGALVYRAQDHLWFTAFGSARTGDFLNMQSYSYGGTMGFDITERFSLELGVQRFYNDLTGRWETLPVVMPGYRFNDKFKLQFDVGPLIYELIRGIIIDHRGGRSDGGPTIRPPVPGFR